MRRILPATLAAPTIGLMACGGSDDGRSSQPKSEQPQAPDLSNEDLEFAKAFFAKYDSKVVEMEEAMEKGNAALKSATTPSMVTHASSYHDIATHLAAEMWVGSISMANGHLHTQMNKLLETATDANSDATNGLRSNDRELLTKAGHEFERYLELRQEMKGTIGR
jgi:hypothetical protein